MTQQQPSSSEESHWGQWVIVGVFGLLLVGAVLTVPNFMRARTSGQLVNCTSNLRKMAAALELYGQDWSGHYPPSLNQLTPKYLAALPTCPAAGQDSYVVGYRSQTEGEQSRYILRCQGEHHSILGLPPDYPRYTSEPV